MSFFGIGEGPSGQEKGQFNLLNSQNQFATGMGESNLTLSSQFFQNLLNDPAKALAPEISASQQQVQQQKKQNAMFGNRGGGVNSANQSLDAANRSNLLSLESGVQTGAATQLGASGSNLLSLAQSGTETAFNESNTLHDQTMNELNDLFKSILGVTGGAISGIPAAANSPAGKAITSTIGGVS